ncbi:MAG: chemotaxis protein CheA [Gammaproteobacteria bacterium]|nr:chemotaxis protein CheA [Gammaproteobacteria bacterium]
MPINLEDEILQDFLVEAGEILEALNEQLVELEKTPQDSELLNAIFRGFHTVKGGASFLALTNLVDVCHHSEDIFNLLRNQKISLNGEMMDVFLKVLDEVNSMFNEIKSGVDPVAVPAELMQQIVAMQKPVVSTKKARQAKVTRQQKTGDQQKKTIKSASEQFLTSTADITDEEFEVLLDNLHGAGVAPKAIKAPDDPANNDANKPVSDEEFAKLISKLDGDDKQPVAAASAETRSASAQDSITEDEFEALLDQLHGKGKAPDKVALPAQARVEAVRPAAPVASKAASNTPLAARREFTENKGETTVRVDTSRLNEIMNLVGELVLTRNRLNTLRQTFEDQRVHKAISTLDLVTADLQNAVMKTRMQPVKKVFGRFPRVVRDLARSLNKEIELELRGEETDLDKNLVEALADPLVHLVRNSVDHGIELPEIREKAGKDRQGKVVLAAEQKGDHIILTISDDGAGMDPEVLRRKAIEKGLIDMVAASRLDDKGCFDLIFLPGLTTKEQLSSVSGRGVGMDVVKTRIMQLNGQVEINSVLGKGTELHIKVPLTLAILPTLMLQLGTRKFALPLSNVSEIFELSAKKINVVDGREVILNRGRASPLFYLRKWLLKSNEAYTELQRDPHVVMVHAGNGLVGFVVDQVIGQEEVVIKPLDRLLQGLPGMAGSTITGDGHIALILDIPGLINAYS